MKAKMLKKAYISLIALWFGVLVLRSMLHLFRTYYEFSSPNLDYKSHIDPCEMEIFSFTNYEDERLLNYRKIGTICENQ